MKKKYIGIIIGIIIVILGVIVISLNSQMPDYKERTVEDWYNDIINNKEVLTIYGASYCSHCQEYYPVIAKLANKYNINLYFFEVDTIREKDQDAYDKLMNSFELSDYDGSVPYTYIMRDGNFVNSTVGFANRDLTVNFLTENGIIKN